LFVPDKPLQLSVIIARKTGACLSGILLRSGTALPSPANIRKGRQGFPGTNTLAYILHSVRDDGKVFVSLTTGVGGSCSHPLHRREEAVGGHAAGLEVPDT